MPEELIVKVSKDGNQWIAAMGPNLQEGVAGIGNDIPTALYRLSEAWESTYCGECGVKLIQHKVEGSVIGVECTNCGYKAGDI